MVMVEIPECGKKTKEEALSKLSLMKLILVALHDTTM